ncbi:MAG: UDP-galactopyranose mutase [Fusobacterium sp.]|nr:UDP-galactopyranose mutase [Fusobacterium sp.]
MSEDTNLVVGAGISGAVIARKIAENINENVLVIDKKEHLAGNCYDYKDKNGITIHKFGSHIFHTNDENVWKFFNKFANFNTYMHKVYALIDGIHTTIPFNFNTLNDVFPETLAKNLELKLLKKFQYNSKVPILEFQKLNDEDLNFLADFIYQKIFLNYTIKQWGLKPDEIDSTVTARVPVLISRDNRYFQDKFQGIPSDGYTKMIENILNHPKIEIKTGVDFKNVKDKKFKRIFYTGSIDEFFDYQLGMLPYRSVSFKFEEYDRPYYQENSVVNYPNNYDFTRIHEYKYYLDEKSDRTVIAKEYSQDFRLGENERYYPIVNEKNVELYTRYKNLTGDMNNVWFLGRLGDYKYYDMDKAAARALECFEEVFGNKAILY